MYKYNISYLFLLNISFYSKICTGAIQIYNCVQILPRAGSKKVTGKQSQVIRVKQGASKYVAGDDNICVSMIYDRLI